MIVLIPSIGESPYLGKILDNIWNDMWEVILVDNSPDKSKTPALDAARSQSKVFERYQQKGRLDYRRIDGTIYEAWNIGIRESTERDIPVAILNDDIIVPPNSLTVAAGGFRDNYNFGLIGLNYFDPQAPVNDNGAVIRVNGTYRTGGFGGFAFVLAPGAPEVDSRFQWWYGDDDLAERLKQHRKKLGIHMGAPVQHPEPSKTGSAHAWTHKAAAEDTELFRALWPTAP